MGEDKKTFMSYQGTRDAAVLADMQNSRDERNIAIDRVGVRNITYPIRVLDRKNVVQHTVGTFTLTVDLPSHFKGTHMSRFLEALNESGGELSVNNIPSLLGDLKARLHASRAHLDVEFMFFLNKPAPVTGKPGVMGYKCRFIADQGQETDFVLQIEVPVTTLCPCSKEISQYGAHNQRGYVTVQVRTKDMVWIEDVIEMIESRASAPLFPVLKRPDEKYVTELAYENPRFVEDMIREVALAFEDDARVTWYSIEVENHESIHAHNAYASLSRSKV